MYHRSSDELLLCLRKLKKKETKLFSIMAEQMDLRLFSKLLHASTCLVKDNNISTLITNSY